MSNVSLWCAKCAHARRARAEAGPGDKKRRACAKCGTAFETAWGDIDVVRHAAPAFDRKGMEELAESLRRELSRMGVTKPMRFTPGENAQ